MKISFINQKLKYTKNGITIIPHSYIRRIRAQSPSPYLQEIYYEF